MVHDADGKPLEALKAAFIANGFQVSASGRGEFVARGPDLRSTDQNPLKGVSEARVRAIGSQMEIHAELGGALWMRRFILLFPPLLGVAVSAGLAAFFWAIGILMRVWFVPLVILCAELPWVVLGPLMARRVRKRTEEAVDSLLLNAGAPAVSSVRSAV